MIATAALPVAVNGRLQMHAFAGLLAAVALDMSRLGAAHVATVRALGHGATLFIDVLQGSIWKTKR